MKKWLPIIIFLSFLLFSKNNIYAVEDFTVNYFVLNEASANSIIKVSADIQITNNNSLTYITAYSFLLDNITVSNVKASNERGILDSTVEKINTKTKITVYFKDPIIGLNNRNNFKVQYETSDLIKKSGQIWEIVIPKLSGQGNFNNYQLQLKVPRSFGKPAYISPGPISTENNDNYLIYNFNKDLLLSSSIHAAFGDFQIYDFTLKYHLYNDEKGDLLYRIPFPPDTAYQRVFYQDIDPKPENIVLDIDGNWLGIYRLKTGDDFYVTASGQAKIFSNPSSDHSYPQKFIKQDFLKEQKYWEVNHPQITKISAGLKSPKEIYNYVVKTLEYDYSRILDDSSRYGAVGILQNTSKALCSEYTDLFITLMRAAGYPARELNGFAYTENSSTQPLSADQDILHSWPEYFDFEKKVWVQVDPTWQDTTKGIDYFNKIDLGHFVFAIHGMDSLSPAPAGSYKRNDEEKKNVEVNFGKYREPNQPQVKLNLSFPKIFPSGTTAKGKIKIENTGGQAIYQADLTIQKSENINLLSRNTVPIEIIPPFGSIDEFVYFRSFNFWRNDEISFKAQAFNQNSIVSIRSFSLVYILIFFLILLFLIFFMYFLFNLLSSKNNLKEKDKLTKYP